MAKIEVNPVAAQAQATKLAQAADGLAVKGTVTYSSQTTIQGNSQAKSGTESLLKAVGQAKGVLERDINFIHSAVASFERTDLEAKNIFEQQPIVK